MEHFSLSHEDECIQSNIFPPPANGSATTTEDQNKQTTINDLPDEILSIIISYFRPFDLITRLSYVCRRWDRLAYRHPLLRNSRIRLTKQELAQASAKRYIEKALKIMHFEWPKLKKVTGRPVV